MIYDTAASWLEAPRKRVLLFGIPSHANTQHRHLPADRPGTDQEPRMGEAAPRGDHHVGGFPA